MHRDPRLSGCPGAFPSEHAPAADAVLTFPDVAEDASFLTASSVGWCQRHHHRLQRHGISPRHLTYAQSSSPLCCTALPNTKAGCGGFKALSPATRIFFDSSRVRGTAMQWANARELIASTTATAVSAARSPRTAGDYLQRFAPMVSLPAAGKPMHRNRRRPIPTQPSPHQTGRRDAHAAGPNRT